MARKRAIKPGYNDSDAIVKLSFAARLLDINLWPYLDGNGMIEDSPSSIKAKVFPRDDIAAARVAELMAELVRGGRFFVLEANGKRWLYRKDFRKEQKIYSDEPRKVAINPDILKAFDESNTLPQENPRSEQLGMPGFVTSPSSFSSTSTSSSSSGALPRVVDNLGDGDKSKTPWLEVQRSDPPKGFFQNLKSKMFSKPEEASA